MRWPWASRGERDTLRHWLDAEREHNQLLRRELLTLTDKYHALRVLGLSEPTNPVVYPFNNTHFAAVVADDVTSAVNNIAGGDQGLRAAMLAQVAEDRRNGLTDPQILQRIAAGTSLEDFVDTMTQTVDIFPTEAESMPS